MTGRAESGSCAGPGKPAPVIRLKGIGKRYPNGTVALQGMSLDIGEHEFVSFLGPSGCGKSTALRMIAGLTTITEGSLEGVGHAALGPSDIGFVFQEPTLMPWARVFDNVFLPLKLGGMSRAEATPLVMSTLEMVGLEQFASAYPRELSGGMKMRASIARALVVRPKLLLMDEPFAALDEMTRFKLNNDLLDLWRLNRWTVVFVTHSVYESVYLSTRIVVMGARPGRVVDELAVDEPYPRGDAFRQTQRYSALCAQTSRILHQAEAAAPEAAR